MMRRLRRPIIVHPAANRVNGHGIMVAGGLEPTFVALSALLRAFDIDTGTELWKHRLPVGGQATPMTYVAGGRQSVVIAGAPE